MTGKMVNVVRIELIGFVQAFLLMIGFIIKTILFVFIGIIFSLYGFSLRFFLTKEKKEKKMDKLKFLIKGWEKITLKDILVKTKDVFIGILDLYIEYSYKEIKYTEKHKIFLQRSKETLIFLVYVVLTPIILLLTLFLGLVIIISIISLDRDILPE